MRKRFIFVLLLVSSLVLVGCKKDDKDDDFDINLRGQDFVIMVDKALSEDPRLDTYAGLFQTQKAAAIKNVEAKYNVKVKYKNYPSNASWGGARERWIVEESKQGTMEAHVLQTSSTSVGILAVQDAIVPLDDLLETYGPKGYWDEKLVFGEVLGKNYLFDDIYSYSDDGLYYNSTLLASVLGKDRKLEPTEMYLNGEWTWEAFEKLAMELNEELDHNRSEELGGPQYVLGGRTYNWAYPMIGANGGVIVDSDFNSNLMKPEVVDTLDFISKLRLLPGMWIDNAPLSNASQPEFTAGNVVFHNGMSWHLSASNKWGGRDPKMEIDFVPYPAGPNVTKNGAEYAVTHVYGKPSFAISSAFSKDNIRPGYENSMLHEETIFRIFADLQYFPEIDENTGKISIQPFMDELYDTRLVSNYGSEKSIEAHLDVFTKARPDFFYSLEEAQGHIPGSYMLLIQDAVQNGTVRTKLTEVDSQMDEILRTRFRER